MWLWTRLFSLDEESCFLFKNKTHRVEHSWHRAFAELDAHSSPVKLRATRAVSVTSPLLVRNIAWMTSHLVSVFTSLPHILYGRVWNGVASISKKKTRLCSESKIQIGAHLGWSPAPPNNSRQEYQRVLGSVIIHIARRPLRFKHPHAPSQSDFLLQINRYQHIANISMQIQIYDY